MGTLTNLIQGQLSEDDIPVDVGECIQLLSEARKNDNNSSRAVSEDIEALCLQQFYWKFGGIEWKNFNITDRDKSYVNSLIGSLVRQKRQVELLHSRLNFDTYYERLPVAENGTRPRTGFRIRKEYRRLTDGERSVFHETLRTMKTSGIYDTFANLHTGANLNSAHNGPNFPSWHRVYLSLFEEAMRQISPSVTLPYWDSTLDFDMPNPVDSIIWSPSFLGNGNGLVTSGPFANWMTNNLQLRRNVGGGSTLFSKEIVDRIATRCRNSEILTPTAQRDYDLEFYHGGPHVWVGGHLAFLDSAAHDPVFFMHHAFIDYMWEKFRIRQKVFCRINPENDYPSASNNLHASERPMDGFREYRNIDGYRNYWTQYWYRYESLPSCSKFNQDCGTPYLRCDLSKQRCVSVERSPERPGSGGGGIFGGFSISGGSEITLSFAELPAQAKSSIQLARSQEAMLGSGPKFNAPPAEPRTQEAQMAMAAA